MFEHVFGKVVGCYQGHGTGTSGFSTRVPVRAKLSGVAHTV